MNYGNSFISRLRNASVSGSFVLNNQRLCLASSSRFYRWQHEYQRQRRYKNGWQGHGTDLLNESLAHNDGVPKIILHGHSSSGFDILNMVKNMDQEDEKLRQTGGIVHCTGSILVLPSACFLWNVRQSRDLTVESLAPVLLYRPKLDYLLLGCNLPVDNEQIKSIRMKLRRDNPNLVVELLDVSNAMGTFNVLNGEDRRVAAVFILPPDDGDN
mmetsp:Transcript_24066/g.51156  ORF Transcript_24066/g.51156 Transcript_24066/m.51156 type:complete len:213 (-) Transcript_24066:213-851(-)